MKGNRYLMINSGPKKSLNSLFNNYSFYIICLVFLILIIIKIKLTMNFYGPFIFPDEVRYNSVAQNIVHGKLYGKLGVFSPGYPILFSSAYYVSNSQIVIYHFMLIISAFISSTIIFPSYFILDKYCSKIISILGSIAMSTLTFLNFFSFTLMTEVLFTPLFLFSIWFILKCYEVYDKKWALLASLSTVYLYITRSTGLAMLIAFILIFIFYILVNFKTEKALVLIQKKKIVILSFFFFLLTWLIYSTYFVDIHQPFNEELRKTYNYGSAYNIQKYAVNYQSFNEDIRANYNQEFVSNSRHIDSHKISKHGIFNLVSIGNGFTLIQLFSSLFDYLLVGSFLFLFVIIFYFILLVTNRKPLKNHTLSIPVLYSLISLILLMAFTIIFLVEGGERDRIIGRYIEPAIPVIMIMGIICLSNFDQKILNKKNILCFSLVGTSIILIMPYFFSWDNIIINVFNDLQDNPTLYAYNVFYGYPTLNAFSVFYGSIISKQMIPSYFFSSLLMSAYFFIIIVLMTISMKNKRYICLLLVFIILSSLFFSTTLYHLSVRKSNEGDNSIARYLTNNTNDETIYLIDLATTYNDARTEEYVYGFWNQGDFSYVNSKSISQKVMEGYTKIYLISTRSLPYNIVANDSNFTLYQVE
jgi:hypothetical protein